jgi:C1A family cysteine protease
MGLFTGMMGNSNMSLAELDESSGGFDLVPPAKPRGLCLGLSGLDLVVCQRYVETLPVSLGDRRADDDKSSTFSLDSDGVTPNTSGYNFFLISKYATRVQNQGSEGACTAFGMAHTLGILARIKGKTGEYNAWNIWNSQGQQPSTTAAISAAKRMNFEGLRISKSRNFYPSVTSYKRMLDSGRPIYFASDVDGSWNGASRGNAALSCRGSTGAHAYTIVGYDDSNQKFVIKNSWGDYWGDQGYGYLPYSCIRRMNDYGYDIEVN